MRVILDVILIVLDIYWWVVLATIILSWLIAFNVINTRNQVVDTIWRTLLALTEPVLRPIRRILPKLQGIDLSPIVLFILIFCDPAGDRPVHLPECLLRRRPSTRCPPALRFRPTARGSMSISSTAT